MTNLRITDTEWNTARTVCTPAQLQALDYWRHGYGYKRIAIILHLSSSTARGRIDRGLDNIRRHHLQSTTSDAANVNAGTHAPRP